MTSCSSSGKTELREISVHDRVCNSWYSRWCVAPCKSFCRVFKRIFFSFACLLLFAVTCFVVFASIDWLRFALAGGSLGFCFFVTSITSHHHHQTRIVRRNVFCRVKMLLRIIRMRNGDAFVAWLGLIFFSDRRGYPLWRQVNATVG